MHLLLEDPPLPNTRRTSSRRASWRIVNTGINCFTIHCRTRNMRPRERTLVHLKKIVDLSRASGAIENDDCIGVEDARRIRAIVGADSVMIATATEANPTVFLPHLLTGLENTPFLRVVCSCFSISRLTHGCMVQISG